MKPGNQFPETISKKAHEVAKLGYIIQETGWTYKEIMETPAGIIDDILCYFNAFHAEESRRMEDTTSGGSSDSSIDESTGVVKAKGLNPNIDYSKASGFKVDQTRQRRTPMPVNGNL